MGCTFLVREAMGDFTDTETRLGSFILEHSREVIHMNTRQFADCGSTSPAAVVRFSQKLGFRGFTELKLDLAKESGTDFPDEFQAVLKDSDSMETLVQKAEHIYCRNVSQTYRMLNIPVLNDAVEALCRAHNIHLFGVGASGLLAMDFQYKLSRIGIPALYHADAHTNLATAVLLTPEDVAIAVSYSGETTETLMAAQAAKAGGCQVISITRPGRSSLASQADFPLFVPGDEQELRVGAMTSRISGLLVLDLLYLGIAMRDYGKTEERLLRTREIIRRLQQ